MVPRKFALTSRTASGLICAITPRGAFDCMGRPMPAFRPTTANSSMTRALGGGSNDTPESSPYRGWQLGPEPTARLTNAGGFSVFMHVRSTGTSTATRNYYSQDDFSNGNGTFVLRWESGAGFQAVFLETGGKVANEKKASSVPSTAPTTAGAEHVIGLGLDYKTAGGVGRLRHNTMSGTNRGVTAASTITLANPLNAPASPVPIQIGAGYGLSGTASVRPAQAQIIRAELWSRGFSQVCLRFISQNIDNTDGLRGRTGR